MANTDEKRSAASMTSVRLGLNSGHAGVSAMIWMSEDKRWIPGRVWEFESALQRTLKVRPNNGPIFKRGQFRYTFDQVSYENIGGKRKKITETISDYFSEDDDSVLIFEDDRNLVRPQGAKW